MFFERSLWKSISLPSEHTVIKRMKWRFSCHFPGHRFDRIKRADHHHNESHLYDIRLFLSQSKSTEESTTDGQSKPVSNCQIYLHQFLNRRCLRIVICRCVMSAGIDDIQQRIDSLISVLWLRSNWTPFCTFFDITLFECHVRTPSARWTCASTLACALHTAWALAKQFQAQFLFDAFFGEIDVIVNGNAETRSQKHEPSEQIIYLKRVEKNAAKEIANDKCDAIKWTAMINWDTDVVPSCVFFFHSSFSLSALPNGVQTRGYLLLKKKRRRRRKMQLR